jgi:hypothetical protein
MASGWDVLLSGEGVAAGRMDLGGGLRVRGRVRQQAGLGVRVCCEVYGEGPSAAEDVFEAALEERRGAREAEGALRAVA